MSAIAILSAALESAGVSGVVALQHARGYKCSVLNACKQPCTRAIKQAPHARTLCAEQPKIVEAHPSFSDTPSAPRGRVLPARLADHRYSSQQENQRNNQKRVDGSDVRESCPHGSRLCILGPAPWV